MSDARCFFCRMCFHSELARRSAPGRGPDSTATDDFLLDGSLACACVAATVRRLQPTAGDSAATSGWPGAARVGVWSVQVGTGHPVPHLAAPERGEVAHGSRERLAPRLLHLRIERDHEYGAREGKLERRLLNELLRLRERLERLVQCGARQHRDLAVAERLGLSSVPEV
eukprot:5503837-Prymnesium_polylepis.2